MEDEYPSKTFVGADTTKGYELEIVMADVFYALYGREQVSSEDSGAMSSQLVTGQSSVLLFSMNFCQSPILSVVLLA